MNSPSPSQTLSEQIAKELLAKGLLPAAAQKKFIQALSEGTLRESDWKVYLEENINKPKTPDNEIK